MIAKDTTHPKTQEGWMELLIDNWNNANENEPDTSRLSFLANDIFEIHTYDSEKDELFAGKMVDVIEALVNKNIQRYQDTSDQNHTWYLLMAHFPWLGDKLSWGTSIRGAWFDYRNFNSGLKVDIANGRFVSRKEVAEAANRGPGEYSPWTDYMRALIEFARTPEQEKAQDA